MKLNAIILHTFRERASRVTLLVLAAVSTLILVAVALAVGSQPDPGGTVLTFFGRPASAPMDAAALTDAVRRFQAGFIGPLFFGIVLFGVLAGAGLLPSVLEKGIADVYFSKPIPRWYLLAGTVLGAVLAIGANALWFLGGLWLIGGLKFGVWNAGLFPAAGGVALAFAAAYAVTALAGVATRSTVLAILASFLFLAFVQGLLASRERTLYLLSENGLYRRAVDLLYYTFPQVDGALEAARAFAVGGAPAWGGPLQALLACAAWLGAAAVLLHRKDF